MNGTSGDTLATIRAKVNLDAERRVVAADHDMNAGLFCTDYAPGYTGKPSDDFCVVHEAYWPDGPGAVGYGCIAVDAVAAREYLDEMGDDGYQSALALATVEAANG